MTMNDSIETTALLAARTQRAKAREQCEAAKAAADRAQQMADDATSDVADLERRVAEAHARRGRQLADLIAAGGPSTHLPVQNDNAAAALTSARVHAAITAEALKSLRAAYESAKAKANATQAAVVAVVEEIITGEARELAARVKGLEDEALALREQIYALGADELYRVAGAPFMTYPILQERTIDRALSPPRFGEVSRYIGMLMEPGPHRARIAAAGDQWHEQIRSLIEGEEKQAASKAA